MFYKVKSLWLTKFWWCMDPELLEHYYPTRKLFFVKLAKNPSVLDRPAILTIELKKKKPIWIKGILVDKYWSHTAATIICDMPPATVYWFVYLSFIWMMDEISTFHLLSYFLDALCSRNAPRRGHRDLGGWISLRIPCVHSDAGPMRLSLTLVHHKTHNNSTGR